MSGTEIWSQVQQAVHSGNAEKVKHVYTAHQQPYTITAGKGGWNVLHYAAYHGKLAVVRHVVESGVSVNSRTRDGWTAVYLACVFGRTDVVRYLWEQGADVTIPSYSGGNTPLHVAANGNNVDTARCLVRTCGVDVDVCANSGSTPLHSAARYGQLDTVQCLIEELNADIDVKDSMGRSPLAYAVSEGEVGTVRYLCSFAHNQSPEMFKLYYEDAKAEFERSDYSGIEVRGEEMDMLLVEISNEVFRASKNGMFAK